jgi:hypothetical protein
MSRLLLQARLNIALPIINEVWVSLKHLPELVAHSNVPIGCLLNLGNPFIFKFSSEIFLDLELERKNTVT